MNILKYAKIVSRFTLVVASVYLFSGVGTAAADPVNLLYNFQASGQFTSAGANGSTYTINAVGRAPRISSNGIIATPRSEEDDGYTVVLTNAAITFDNFDPKKDPIVNFSCHGCKLTFPDGSILESDPHVPLEGRALFLYGPVAPNPLTPNLMTIRMAGCSGLRETAIKGKLAGKVGSICFNGSFNFDMANMSVITGESNCTIVTHTPVMQ
jgi:hypothetical protein